MGECLVPQAGTVTLRAGSGTPLLKLLDSVLQQLMKSPKWFQHRVADYFEECL